LRGKIGIDKGRAFSELSLFSSATLFRGAAFFRLMHSRAEKPSTTAIAARPFTVRPGFAIFPCIAFVEFRAVGDVAVTPLCET
jgi:hypothetical protein